MQILETIQREGLLENVKVLGVAVSGGSDSMCLLSYLAQHLQVPLKVINIEHGIRGEASKRDSQFVAEYCAQNNLEFIGKTCDCLLSSRQKGENLELNAKKARYDIFYELIGSGVVDAVATAHNQSDNAESALMHLLRGSGLGGVCGIEYRTKRKIIRPLLDTSKAEILAYLEKQNVPYVEDESNNDLQFTRNYLRKEVFPILQNVNERALENILGFIARAREDEKVLQALAQEFVQGTRVKTQAFSNPGLGYRAIKKALETLGETSDFLNAHYDSIVSLKKNGQIVTLANGVRAALEYDWIRLYYERPTKSVALPFAMGSFVYGGYMVEIAKGQGEGLKIKNTASLQGAIIRSMQEGDYFKSCNGHTKKIQKYFTDKKIPKALRADIPLLCIGNEVVAVFGVEISDYYKTEKGQEVVTLGLKNHKGESALLAAAKKEKI